MALPLSAMKPFMNWISVRRPLCMSAPSTGAVAGARIAFGARHHEIFDFRQCVGIAFGGGEQTAGSRFPNFLDFVTERTAHLIVRSELDGKAPERGIRVAL